MGFFDSTANLVAVGLFLGMAVAGIVLAQVLGKQGDRQAALKRRLKFVNIGAGDELENELSVDSDVFGDTGEERSGDGRIAVFISQLDAHLALIGGVRIFRKATPIALGAGVVAMFGAMLQFDLPMKYAAVLGLVVFAGGLVLGLQMYLGRTYDKFLTIFPDAIDLVVRSIRAGLPVSQALENIGNDVGAPVGPEFARISNQMRIGVSLDDAMHAALSRINLPEMRFFAVTLILQRETGGQLAEVLLNLSDTLRERKAMKMKIKALTSESRAASKIVAAIPILSGVGMYHLNKPHMMLLFETEVGHTMLMYCVGSIFVGLMIIKKLTAVDS